MVGQLVQQLRFSIVCGGGCAFFCAGCGFFFGGWFGGGHGEGVWVSVVNQLRLNFLSEKSGQAELAERSN